MKGIVFLFVGVILLAVAGIVFATVEPGNVNVRMHGVSVDPATAISWVRYGVSGLLGFLGGLFVLLGLIAFVRASSQKKRQMHILATGIDTEGTVTFVDRNFRILVNQTPIYSIVEYTYQDRNGATHTRRIDQVNSEMVIRAQIQVGSKIRVKYAAENPAESVMVLG